MSLFYIFHTLYWRPPPPTILKSRWEIYILGFLQCSIEIQRQYRLLRRWSSHCSHIFLLLQSFCHTKWNYTHKTLPINILQTHESHIRTSGASNCIITIIIITIIIIIKHFKDAGFQVTTTTTSILHFSICERTKTSRGKENIYLFCKYFKDITRWCKSYKKIRDFWDDK